MPILTFALVLYILFLNLAVLVENELYDVPDKLKKDYISEKFVKVFQKINNFSLP